MVVIRPADPNETVATWRIAIERRKGPDALMLSRQRLLVLDLASYPSIPEGVLLTLENVCKQTHDLLRHAKEKP
jgi:transketolase